MALAIGLGEGLASPAASPKTPRTLRGVVRRCSKVAMSYPNLPAPLPDSPKQRRMSSTPSTRPSTSASSTPLRQKKVSFADEVEESAAIKRSKHLLEGLYELRRCGWEKPEEGVPVEPPDEPLMRETLKDTEDTAAGLEKIEAMLKGAHEPVYDHGGKRHATAVVSARTLAVVHRKRELLQACDDRLAAFKETQARSEEILRGLIDDTCEQPPALVGVHKFLKAHLHKNGNPVDENKSDFQSFVSGFGLPPGHRVLGTIDDLASAATLWWAEAALREAQAGADTRGVNRVLNLAIAIQGNPDHPAIVQCREFLGDALARNALRNARALQEKDRALCERSKQAQPESAKNCAELVNGEITTAVAMGAPPKHPDLSLTKQIATEFQKFELERWGQRCLEYATNQWEKDAANALKCSGVPPVGPASQAADAIERDIKDTMGKGVPENNESLKAAKALAKALRDEDGQRKRMAAREKRLQAAGEKK